MATYKQVTLKDPKTGDYLIPRVYGTLSYQLVNGEITPPFDPQLDAYTLQGHEASYFATATELDTVKTSVSEGKALIAAAVTDKGVSTAADATFQQIATNIGKIENLNINKVTINTPNDTRLSTLTNLNKNNGNFLFAYGNYLNYAFEKYDTVQNGAVVMLFHLTEMGTKSIWCTRTTSQGFASINIYDRSDDFFMNSDNTILTYQTISPNTGDGLNPQSTYTVFYW